MSRRGKMSLDAVKAKKTADPVVVEEPSKVDANGPGRPRKHDQARALTVRLDFDDWAAIKRLADDQAMSDARDGRPMTSVNDLIAEAVRDYLAKRAARG